eukprot:GEMP01031908.1.p1 GENE.GEMP01031908.1~~GEMP01031908.1.p1  ORF type:complete len:203 (+),score=45.88 GEMP01031908.1:190-798(+)
MGTLVAHVGQQKNPLMSFVTEVFKEYAEIPCDFLCGPNIAVLYLSLRFHRLQPTYFEKRLESVASHSERWKTKIVLCQVDVENVDDILEQIQLLLFHGSWSLYLAGTSKAAARYLETLVVYQNKSADIIRGRLEADKEARMVDVLCSSAINKTDAKALLSQFGSLQNVLSATKEDLMKVPGIGKTKVESFWRTFHSDFDAIT